MTKDEALAELRLLLQVERGRVPGDPRNDDTEACHVAADEVLLQLIGDAEVREAFETLPKWYA